MSQPTKNISLSLASLSAGKIDETTGIISGVAVITKGPLRAGDARDIEIDQTTLQQIERSAKTYANGLKVKLDHDGGAGDIVGCLKNFRIEGDVLRADLHILQNTPHREYILEIAKKLADTFGLSVAFSGQSEKRDGVTLARCTEIYSCDLVSEPAANLNGLFSTEFPMTPDDIKNLTDQLSALSARMEKLEKKPTDAAMPCAADIEKNNLALVAHAFDKGAEELFKKFGAKLGQSMTTDAGPSSPAQPPAQPGALKFEDLCKLEMNKGKNRMEATELVRKANPKAHEDFRLRTMRGETVIY